MTALLRAYRADDLPAITEIYVDAVRGIASALYSTAQVDAWAAYAEQGSDLAVMLAQGYRLVVENETGGLDAFAVLDPADYVSLLYCHPRASRRGYATRLLEALEAEARRRGIARVRTAASLISQPLFLRHGYTIDYSETVDRNGVAFDRYRMSKRL